MYMNTNTINMLEEISHYVHCLPNCPNSKSMIQAIEILMLNNNFKFCDTYWLQKPGTVMGTLSDPSYATIYFGIHELKIIPHFKLNLPFDLCFIDNACCIWYHHHNAEEDICLWEAFKQEMNCFGCLTWGFVNNDDAPLLWIWT